MEFLTVAEEILESLGDDQEIYQETAHQLIYDVLVEPAKHLNLPTTLLERKTFETQQMRAYAHKRPEVGQCR